MLVIVSPPKLHPSQHLYKTKHDAGQNGSIYIQTDREPQVEIRRCQPKHSRSRSTNPTHIERLRNKLADTIYPSHRANDCASDWSRGVPHREIERLGTYWLHDYPWVKALSKLNRLPQYTLNIDISGFGVHGVHFLHQQSARANAIPLLFLHSWPGSFLEVTKILGPLTDDSNRDLPAFNVVAPSLLDFGFSSPTSTVRCAR